MTAGPTLAFEGVAKSFGSVRAVDDLLPRWAALLVLLAYVGILAAIGRFTTLRRDIG